MTVHRTSRSNKPTGSTVCFWNTILLVFCQSTVTQPSTFPPIHVPPLYRVSQELRSLLRDLIPELILSQKCPIRPDWNEVALRHTGNTSVIVFVEEHSLRVLAVHLAKIWHKYHLSDVAGKCTDQSVGRQWHHTTRLRKSDVGSCFRQFHEDYHNPINGSFL